MRRTLIGLAIASAALVPAMPDDSVDGYIETAMAESGVPGLAYAVVDDGEIVETGTFGVLRAGSDAEVTTHTPFLTGSISKSFTALQIMQLVEAGSMDLDERVATYLAEFHDTAIGAITIRQLLSHTSGFSTLQGNQSHTDNTGADDELERAVDELATVVPDHAPGESWEYSNTNYLILGRVIEVVTGQDYQTAVRAGILQPLGMTDSFVSDGAIHDAMATGHRPWFGSKLPLAENSTERSTAPQGGVIASATDLATYLGMMMNDQADLLSPEGKTLLMTPAGEAAPFYGLGWFVDAESGRVWHGGTSPGFESLATMLPSQNRGVVVLVNGGSGLGFGETAALLDGITARALDVDAPDDSPVSRKLLFAGLLILPLGYALAIVWAVVRRARLRQKPRSGIGGQLSLWFPVVTTGVAAWVFLGLVPTLIGSPIGNLLLFQPDVGLAFVASAALGVLWSATRIIVAYTGSRPEVPLWESRSRPI